MSIISENSWMAEIVKTRGSLYFLRDIDYLTGEKGAYVKIGIVRKDKKTLWFDKWILLW